MRILKVTQSYYPYLERGGPAVKIPSAARHLAHRGHEVTVITADYGPRGDEGDGVPLEVLYLRGKPLYRTITFSPGLLPFCLRRLRGFDVVHLYGIYDLFGPTVAAFCRRWGVPYVIEPMGMYLPIVRSIVKKRVYHRIFGRRLVDDAAALVATSDRERDELLDAGLAPERVILRRNGIDMEDFERLPARGRFRRRHGIPQHAPLALFLGRISRKKGLDQLVKAFSDSAPGAWLAILGPDDGDGCLQELNRLRSQLGLDARVLLPGAAYGAGKLEALVDADVFVLPSQSENFGNAAAEAIAAGTPVLVTDRCGIAPLVDGSAGLVVPYGREPLADGLSRLLQGGSLLAELRAGCDEVARRLSWDEPIDRMEELYARVAGELHSAAA